MATYTELYDNRGDDALGKKIITAITVKATALLDGTTPTANQVAWASEALTNPRIKAEQITGYVLAVNKGVDINLIVTAADTAVQTNVDAAVDAIIAGMV